MLYNILSSDKTSWYQVIKNQDKWSCTCPHWIFRLKKKSVCKHIEEAKKLLNLSAEDIFSNIDWEDPVPLYLEVSNR